MYLAGSDKRLPFLSRIDGKIVFFKFVPVWRDDLNGCAAFIGQKKGQLSSWPKGGLVNKNRRDFAKHPGVSHGLLLAE